MGQRLKFYTFNLSSAGGLNAIRDNTAKGGSKGLQNQAVTWLIDVSSITATQTVLQGCGFASAAIATYPQRMVSYQTVRLPARYWPKVELRHQPRVREVSAKSYSHVSA